MRGQPEEKARATGQGRDAGGDSGGDAGSDPSEAKKATFCGCTRASEGRGARHTIEPDLRWNTVVMMVRSLPNSSVKVLNALATFGAMYHGDIVKKTKLASRTVRYALKKLREHHLIVLKLDLRGDMRKIIYRIG